MWQHSMALPFYANRAKVAPRTRTAREAPSLERAICNITWKWVIAIFLWQDTTFHNMTHTYDVPQ